MCRAGVGIAVLLVWQVARYSSQPRHESLRRTFGNEKGQPDFPLYQSRDADRILNPYVLGKNLILEGDSEFTFFEQTLHYFADLLAFDLRLLVCIRWRKQPVSKGRCD